MPWLLTFVLVLQGFVLPGFVFQVDTTFRNPSVDARRTPRGTLQLVVDVEVGGEPDAVLLHVIDPGHDETVASLAPRGGSTWGGTVEVEAADHILVFEAIFGTTSVQSQPRSLTQLGVPDELIGGGRAPIERDRSGGLSPAARRWMWLAVAFAAAALALVAYWAMGEDEDAPDEPAEDDETGPPAPRDTPTVETVVEGPEKGVGLPPPRPDEGQASTER